MKKAVIYTRAKVNLADLSLVSVQAQALSCKEYAEQNGIQVVGFYADIVLTGSPCNDAVWKSIVHKRKPDFDTILVYDYSRIGRIFKQVYKDRMILENKGIRIASVSENVSESEEKLYFDISKEIERRTKHDRK